jgi:hypothetical protein
LIHYHGGPIWPESAAAKIWKNRHSFVSFARPEQIGVAAHVSGTFALDNGAFSFWKSGNATDWNGYYEFVEKWNRHPGFDWALIPDVIAGDVQQNMDLIDEWPFSKNIGVPVWHLHEPLHWLVFLCEGFQRVAIGSSGEFAKIGTDSWWNRMAEAMNKIVDGNGRPICKLHGLRMLDPAVFTKFPFSSCDSTNVAQNCRDSKRWTVYNPPNNETRGLVLAERIESFNSLELWKQQYTQQMLF